MRTQPSSQIRPQAAEPPRVLLMAQDAYGFTTRINDFKRGGADPSQTKFFIGGNDVTQNSRVTNVGNGSVEVSVKLKEPLKAQANLEIRLETNKRGGGTVESTVVADVVANVFTTSNVFVFRMPDQFFSNGAEDFVFVNFDGKKSYFLKNSASLVGKNVDFDIEFVDEAGKFLNISSEKNFSISSNSSDFKYNTGTLKDGKLQLSLTYLTDTPASSSTSIEKIVTSEATNNRSLSILASSNSECFMVKFQQKNSTSFDYTQIVNDQLGMDGMGYLLVLWFFQGKGADLVLKDNPDVVKYLKLDNSFAFSIFETWKKFAKSIADGNRPLSGNFNLIDNEAEFLCGQGLSDPNKCTLTGWNLIHYVKNGTLIQGTYTATQNNDGTYSIKIRVTYTIRDFADLNCQIIPWNVEDCFRLLLVTGFANAPGATANPQSYKLIISWTEEISFTYNPRSQTVRADAGTRWPFLPVR
jgi:hypothetical protein